jgi:beta-galactosidase
MTNEAFFTFNLDRARPLMAELVELSRELDPTRPAAIGGAQRGEVDRIGDIAGYNGDGAGLFIDPGVPNMVSEYGAISKPHDAYEPFFGELQSEEFPWRAGQAIWAAFDYGSIAGKQGLKGIVNHQRVPKRSWYWYRNAYRDIAPPQRPVDGTPATLQLSADKTTIDGTDATDDVQIVVTVHDASGRRVKSAPLITLTIESGPGEFPTGRSIMFNANIDIGIADGEAAMAFRSYHGGESVIRATSPGLADAMVIITTRGEPRFVAGVTPIVADRPYVPPPESQVAQAAMRNAVNVALNRPCRASSEAEAHPARFANDGQPATSWQSVESLAWWIVDLEGFYQLASLRLTFEREANYRFVVEISNDAQSWKTSIDRTNTANVKSIRNDVFDPGSTARYVRIRFTHVPPGDIANLCEVELLGILCVR